MPRQDIPILSEGKPELHLTLEKEKSSPRIYWFTNRRYKKNIARLMKKKSPTSWTPAMMNLATLSSRYQGICWKLTMIMMLTMAMMVIGEDDDYNDDDCFVTSYNLSFWIVVKGFSNNLKNSCSQFRNVEWQDFLSLINLIPCFGNSLCLRGHIFCLLLCFFISNILSSSVLIWEITNWS